VTTCKRGVRNRDFPLYDAFRKHISCAEFFVTALLLAVFAGFVMSARLGGRNARQRQSQGGGD